MANHGRVTILVAISMAGLLLAGYFILKIEDHEAQTSLKIHRYFPDTDLEVAVYESAGSQPGPTLLIFGGIHGDEAAGYLAADRYVNLKVRKGRLITVPRLNRPAIAKGTRHGLGGDMNRLFHLTPGSKLVPDAKVVNLAQSLIRQADYVLNLHQADGFYSPVWVSSKRNPRKWGQSNIIDAPFFDLPNGEKLELSRFANAIVSKVNSQISDPKYHFHVNNTNTADRNSLHKEQRGSLTYYALYKEHKVALGVDVTRDCSLTQAIAFLSLVINAVIDEIGIQVDNLPSG